jgi:ferredoxin
MLPAAVAMPVVTILNGDAPPHVVEVVAGTSLFDAGAKVAAGIDTACVGKGTCGLCRVRIVAGAEHLNAYTEEETKHLGNVYHLTKVRLSCRTRIAGDMTIELVRKRKR